MAAIIGSRTSPSSYTTERVVPDERKESSIKSSFCIKNNTICYETDEQRTQVIESVAAHISHFYGTFLQKDWHLERVKAASRTYKGLTFIYADKLPSKFPCLEKIKNFMNLLKKVIIAELKQKSDNVSLSTDYRPQGILRPVLEDSGINRVDIDIGHLLFPIKSGVGIVVREKYIDIGASF